VAVTKIDEFMSKIGSQRGMSLTTGFDVKFVFGPKSTFPKKYYETNKDIIHMLCDEAQLPNIQSATGQISGRYQGEQAVQYPHSKMYTDVGLGFLCDAEMLPAKFFNHWYNWMYGEPAPQLAELGMMEDVLGKSPFDRHRTNRLRYPDEYTCSVYIMKTEPDNTAANGRVPMTYILENAYPYSIDAVPLSYGSSQITRVNVSLYYSRHTLVYGDLNPREIKVDKSDPNLSLNFIDDKNNFDFVSDSIG
tara:strand:+ start:42 stop:785 length:744 start_codon:yes stop_codon:yes gene_type:complete